MKWKKERQPKHSISSVTSMSFLTDQNLTFHRFSDGTISFDGMNRSRKISSNEIPYDDTQIKRKTSNLSDYHPASEMQPTVWTTRTKYNYNTNHPDLLVNESATSTTRIIPDDHGTPSTLNEFQFLPSSASCNNSTNSTSHPHHNGSTMKLITVSKEDSDQSSNQQSRCSIFRGVILCLCLNLTYTNIVRFPRELERHGIGFLIPYLTVLLVIGLPITLLEMSLGQFLGQGSAHLWRASPFFKGASIIKLVASLLGSVFIAMQAAISLLYIGKVSFSNVPFTECKSGVVIKDNRYGPSFGTGQDCLGSLFLSSITKKPLPFGLLAIALIFLWVLIMLCTHSSKINRRSIFICGFLAIILLFFQTGWEVSRTISDRRFPELWPFELKILMESSTWFYALVQVLLSMNIGVGVVPVVTGKFLYKGDAIKTTFVYICFNLLITGVSTLFYMMHFNHTSLQFPTPYPDLTTITAIYDRALNEHDHLLKKLIPGLSFLMIVLSAVVSISLFIYTSSRLVKRHPNYVMCVFGLMFSVAGIVCPSYYVSRYLDMRIVGTLIICAMIVEVISIAWVYGSKALYTDLEFSIGHPIMKLWLVMWSIIPLLLIALLAWWCSVPNLEIIEDIWPRWIPVVFCGAIIIVLACYEVSKQVDYNICNMIQEAARPAKDWGPADPLIRHAWKQWRSVCEDTGERDFTLRRRGTKDYTNSIKKGQYSHANKYNSTNIKNPSTTGSNSPNYSGCGSVFGDSAIEEDISVDKYPNQLEYHHDSRSRKSSTNNNNYNYNYGKRHVSDASNHSSHRQQIYQQQSSHYHSQRIPIKHNPRKNTNYTSRIEITPQDIPYQPPSFPSKNPLVPLEINTNFNASTPFAEKYPYNQNIYRHNHPNGQLINVHNIHIDSEGSGRSGSMTTNTTSAGGTEQLYWRKYSMNSEEFSTEL